eukprot:scaffold18972_cov36-Phaeocystis_antarctica.AAC.2
MGLVAAFGTGLETRCSAVTTSSSGRSAIAASSTRSTRSTPPGLATDACRMGGLSAARPRFTLVANQPTCCSAFGAGGGGAASAELGVGQTGPECCQS